jgi:hypothetical protein
VRRALACALVAFVLSCGKDAPRLAHESASTPTRATQNAPDTAYDHLPPPLVPDSAFGVSDSCNALPSTHSHHADPSTEPPDDPPTPGRWDSVHTITTAEFSIDVPVVARSGRVRDAEVLAFGVFPQCPQGTCRLGVRIFADTVGKGADGYVAGLMRIEAARTNGINEYVGPPDPFVTPHGPGIHVEGGCGDCGKEVYFFSRPGMLAEVSIQTEYQRDGVRRTCQLARVAKTFRWVR